MEGIFLKLYGMSIAASWLILAVIVLRLLLKRAPKWINCLLWGIVAVRLICPVSLESEFSLIPSPQPLPVQNGYHNERVVSDDLYDSQPQSGVQNIDRETINPVSLETNNSGLSSYVPVFAGIWLGGILLLLLYAFISFLHLRRTVRASVLIQDNIYVCDDIRSPFILGIIRPHIYLPSGMDERNLDCVIAHEKVHLKRHDHWWKPLGYILLAVYWFNPLVWAAYILLCRDIELACDEKVVQGMEKEEIASYAQALLDCSFPRRRIIAYPLAFGEVSVKERIKTMLNYKKPAFWIITAAIMACIAVAVCFLTNPYSERTFDLTRAASAIVVSGNTDEAVIIEDTYLELLSSEIEKLRFIRAGKSDNSTGWSYHITWYDADGSPVEDMIIRGDRKIEYNNMLYRVSAGQIDLPHIQNLFEVDHNTPMGTNPLEKTIEDTVISESQPDISNTLFAQMPDTFYFLSGAGAWQTQLYLREDGSFTGIFSDAEAGSADSKEFPNGTIYICEFSGAFTQPQKVDDYTYSVHVRSLEYAEPDEVTYKDGYRYITAEPYGLDNVDEVLIYLPGYPVSELSEEVFSWIRSSGEEFWGTDYPKTLPFYALNNVNKQMGFTSKTQPK